MKMSLVKCFELIIALGISICFPIELKSYSEVILPKETSKYFYQFSKFNQNNYFDLYFGRYTPYIYIKLTNYEKINLRAYLNEDEVYFSQPKKEGEWINIPIKDKNKFFNITLIVTSLERNSKMIFIDSSKYLEINLTQFLNLNFNSNKLYNVPFPIYFNISADKDISFALQGNIDFSIYDEKAFLNDQKELEFNQLNKITYINFIEGETYIIRLNYNQEGNKFFFRQIKILYYMEEIYIKNNTFVINNYTRNNFLKLNIKNYPNISFYVNDNSGMFHGKFNMITLSKDNFNIFIKNISYNINEIQFQKITNGKINNITNKDNDDYLIIGINNENKKIQGFILFFQLVDEINEKNLVKNINKGIHALIYIHSSYSSTVALVSNNNNMKLLKSKNDFSNKIIYNNAKETIIYIDSTKESTKLYCNFFSTKRDINNYYFLTDDDIEKNLFNNKEDIFYLRSTYYFEKINCYSFYLFDIKEKYYIYSKNYFGKNDLYKYKNNLDLYSSINDFMQPFSYYDPEIYEKVNNKLLIVNGTQFFHLNINYGSFFELIIQKVNDYDYIDNKNDAKILNKGKTYLIKFKLNHLIKLDNNFLYSEVVFMDELGKEYILNNENKKIFLQGNNFIVKSNQTTLIYFYKKIESFNYLAVIYFDKSQKGKNMLINITNNDYFAATIAIGKDFGFGGYHPLINFEDFEIYKISRKSTSTFYIENFYDLLDHDINELNEENYFIYIFNLFDEEHIEISSPSYFNSITELNKYYFEIIPPNKNTLLIKSIDEFDFNYQFIKCSNEDINYRLKITNETSTIFEEKLINTNISLHKSFKQRQTLINYFESKSEFLFLYDISYEKTYKQYETSGIRKYEIKYLNVNNKNILSVGFSTQIISYGEYYEIFDIIIARKNDINNLYSFSNPCYIAKILMNNSYNDNICVKRIFSKDKFVFEKINISKIIEDENDDYIINIIGYAKYTSLYYFIYSPLLFNQKKKNKNAIKLKLFQKYVFLPEKDYFLYDHLKNLKIVLHINFYPKSFGNIFLIVTDDNGNATFYNPENNINEIILEKKGQYFFEFFYHEEEEENKGNISFYICSFNELIETIDFSKEIYFGFFINYHPNKNNNRNFSYYKVNNLSEDKTVYFLYENDDNNIYDSPFLICRNHNEGCVNDKFIYNFKKGKEYTIYINLIDQYPNIFNKFRSYYFFNVIKNAIKNIKEEGNYIINTPQIFIINNNKKFYFDIFNTIPIFIYSEAIIQGNNLIDIKISNLNDISIYSFVLEKDYFYRTIVLIPKKNNKLNQIFITYEKSDNPHQIKIESGKTSLINLDNVYPDEYDYKSYLNYFMTFTSPLENIRFVSPDKINKNRRCIFNHFGKKFLYVDKNKNNIDIKIDKKIYEPKYCFFSILNDETFDYFKSYLEKKNIFMNRRINTDLLKINDFIQIYIDKFNIKYNLYIKKYYGQIQLYESEYILDDITTNINMITKPNSNIKNKKSIFNRLIQLDKNQIIFGYLSTNSLLDIYIEQDNADKDIYSSDFKNRKYLKKGIEYHFHFYLNHLIKLEPQLNTEIIIYNEDTKIILNNVNQTGIAIGNNFKMKSNENTMLYFYPKTQKKQKLLKPKKGEIIEIKRNGNVLYHYYIEFGFEGFEPPEMNNFYYERQLYMENVYDKLETKLSSGEYLYLYYYTIDEDIFEINYLNNNTISTSYKYNFYLIKNNTTENKFIIPYINRKKLNLQIRFCKPPYKVIIHYDDFSKELDGKYIHQKYDLTKQSEVHKFTFESESDFILSYSFNDTKDEYLLNNDNLEKERIKLDNLTINYIKIINKNKININFKSSYKNSLAKYIIILTPEEKNNTFENMKNICYLTEIINQKEDNFIIEEIYNIGENDFIELDIDISKIANENKNYIVNIISQELRFEKWIRFYEPKLFYIGKKPIYRKIFTISGGGLLLILAYIIYIRRPKKKSFLKNLRIKMNEENIGSELNDLINY